MQFECEMHSLEERQRAKELFSRDQKTICIVNAQNEKFSRIFSISFTEFYFQIEINIKKLKYLIFS